MASDRILTTEMLQHHSFDIAGRAPENGELVTNLVKILNDKLVEEHPPYWAVATALTIIMECVRKDAETQVTSLMAQAAREQEHGTN